MSTQIFYFSGAGNSLHVAKEMGDRLDGAVLTPMLGEQMRKSAETDAEVIGFVFPIHCFAAPLVVKQFLRRLRIRKDAYLFAASSRFCIAKVFDELDAILSAQGRRLDASFAVNMPQTYLPTFDVDAPGEAARKEEAMLEAMDRIADTVRRKETYHRPDSKNPFVPILRAIRPLLMFLYEKTRYFGLGNRLYTDANCTSCSICAKVCPAGRIDMREGRPVWNRDSACTYCLACVHYCPARSIQVRRTKSARKGRYHHPAVSPAEMMEQKH